MFCHRKNKRGRSKGHQRGHARERKLMDDVRYFICCQEKSEQHEADDEDSCVAESIETEKIIYVERNVGIADQSNEKIIEHLRKKEQQQQQNKSDQDFRKLYFFKEFFIEGAVFANVPGDVKAQ